MTSNSETVHRVFEKLAVEVVQALEAYEPDERFQSTAWEHTGGGGGLSRLLLDGQCFEKAGVNFSHVRGTTLPTAAVETRPQLQGQPFEAIGVSVVAHPLNPYVPATHANIRFIGVPDHKGILPSFWFGGGFDLTPYYPFLEDCVHWHACAEAACRTYGKDLYPRLKEWCDRYFYLRHRQEQRGIGGIFFDDLVLEDFSTTLDFVTNVVHAFLEGYIPIVEKRRSHVWEKRQREFQLLRRGRYVEFNLLYDRGTLFGLQSLGRVDSIFMSLPPMTGWGNLDRYRDYVPERELGTFFLKARDWLDPALKDLYRKQETK
ncbi:MAG: oxygen-dependent coproporphyrinogen oxidase [Gammaproteobacteria bacterium]